MTWMAVKTTNMITHQLSVRRPGAINPLKYSMIPMRAKINPKLSLCVLSAQNRKSMTVRSVLTRIAKLVNSMFANGYEDSKSPTMILTMSMVNAGIITFFII